MYYLGQDNWTTEMDKAVTFEKPEDANRKRGQRTRRGFSR
jgi:hypothetical protein